MRIAIFWNYLYHYRIPFYEKLGQVPGIEVTVFHGGFENSKNNIKQNALEHYFRSIKIKTREINCFGAVIYFQTCMWKILFSNRYDAIVCEGNFGILSNLLIALYSKIMRIRFLYWAAGWERGRIKGLPAQLRKLYIKITARLADGYLCYGSNSRTFLVKHGVDPGKCTIVQNTIDTDRILEEYQDYQSHISSAKESLKLGQKKVILSVGRLIPNKRLDLLIHAFHIVRMKHKDVCLIIIGDGQERDKLVEITKKKVIPDVFFFGSIINGVGQYFALSDIFVLPGTGGLAINEAMAYGLPVICSEADGTEKDLVINGLTGSFFKKGDVYDLAAKIEEILISDDVLEKMRKASREHIYKVASMPIMVESFLGALLRSEKKYQWLDKP
jgi:glycosyltransferase involved in cell wall biosynthesis